MTTHHTNSRRVGFTLIELIVVISLIAVLVALSAGTYFKVRNVAQDQATTSMMIKLNSHVDGRWSAVLSQAEQDYRENRIPAQIMAAANGDKDLARVLWTHMLLRNEFPTTFQEARLSTDVNGYSLSARAVFSGLPAVPVTNEPELQSAICLYIALQKTGNRGMVMSLDGLQTGEVEFPTGSGTTYTVFKDSWGTPIGFCRMAYSPETNTSSYARAGEIAGRNKADPLGKLAGWSKPNQLLFWNLVTANHLPYTWNVPGVGTQTFPAGFAQTGFPYDAPAANPPVGPWNWVPTLFSAGPNKSFGSLLGGSSTDPGNDNVLSFRLRREGNRGD